MNRIIGFDEDGELETECEPCNLHCPCGGPCDLKLGHPDDNCQCSKCTQNEITADWCARGVHEPAIIDDPDANLVLGHCVHCGKPDAGSAEAA